MYASFLPIASVGPIFIVQLYLVSRFDIADDETTVNITPDERRQVPSTLIPSPARTEDPPQQQEPYYAAPSPVQEEPEPQQG